VRVTGFSASAGTSQGGSTATDSVSGATSTGAPTPATSEGALLDWQAEAVAVGEDGLAGLSATASLVQGDSATAASASVTTVAVASGSDGVFASAVADVGLAGDWDHAFSLDYAAGSTTGTPELTVASATATASVAAVSLDGGCGCGTVPVPVTTAEPQPEPAVVWLPEEGLPAAPPEGNVAIHEVALEASAPDTLVTLDLTLLTLEDQFASVTASAVIAIA
jgi:hypothetical protein